MKFSGAMEKVNGIQSHPTGVRGLKFQPMQSTTRGLVAPHWGAWIEIAPTVPSTNSRCLSHPTGVRGLKYGIRPVRDLAHGVAPHWGAWIEIQPHRLTHDERKRRTPLGCVD